MTSKFWALAATASSRDAKGARGSGRGRLSRIAEGQTGTRLALVLESAEANNVTSCPSATNSSVNHDTTRSVPPYSFGGTRSASGATCAIRIGHLIRGALAYSVRTKPIRD
jgi:hypothetical protein